MKCRGANAAVASKICSASSIPFGGLWRKTRAVQLGTRRDCSDRLANEDYPISAVRMPWQYFAVLLAEAAFRKAAADAGWRR
jgi:hypothetical protein